MFEWSLISDICDIIQVACEYLNFNKMIGARNALSGSDLELCNSVPCSIDKRINTIMPYIWSPDVLSVILTVDI